MDGLRRSHIVLSGQLGRYRRKRYPVNCPGEFDFEGSQISAILVSAHEDVRFSIFQDLGIAKSLKFAKNAQME